MLVTVEGVEAAAVPVGLMEEEVQADIRVAAVQGAVEQVAVVAAAARLHTTVLATVPPPAAVSAYSDKVPVAQQGLIMGVVQRAAAAVPAAPTAPTASRVTEELVLSRAAHTAEAAEGAVPTATEAAPAAPVPCASFGAPGARSHRLQTNFLLL